MRKVDTQHQELQSKLFRMVALERGKNSFHTWATNWAYHGPIDKALVFFL